METSTQGSDMMQKADRSRLNMTFFIAEVFLFGVALPSTARFLPVYAIRLDASAALLSWLTALPAIIAMVSSGFSGWWRRRCGSLERATVFAGFGFRLMFLLPAFTPFFPRSWQPVWLLMAISLPALAQGTASVVFLVLLRSSVLEDQVTAVVSRRTTMFNVGVALGTVVLGIWLERAPFPLSYQIMYVLAFIMALVSLSYVRRVRVVDTAPPPVAHQVPPQAFASPGFRRVVTVTMVTYGAFFAVMPIIPLRVVDDLGATEGFMSLFALAELSAAAVAATQTNRLVRRWGSQPVIAVGLVGTAGASALFGLATSLPLTLVGSALSGAAWTMAAISVFGYFTENTPQESVARFTRIFNQVMMLSVFIGPMLGNQLVQIAPGLPTVLFVGAGARLLAGVWVVFGDSRWLRRDRRSARPLLES